MADKLVIEIELKLDGAESKIDKVGDKTTQKFKDVSKEIESSIEKGVSKGVQSSESKIDGLFNSLRRVSTLIATAPPTGKGVFGLLTASAFTSAALESLSALVGKIDNQIAKKLSESLEKASFAIDAFSLALSFGISAVSKFAFELGTNLVKSLQGVANQSLKSTQTLDTFINVIENFNKSTDGAIGTSESWVELIERLSSKFNILTTDLQKGAQEIVLVGSQLGLTENQLKKLLTISSEYAKINKKELFPVALAFVKALNGQSLSAQTLGVKLTEASVKAFALKKGFEGTFEKLSENEKVQLRYNKLLKQYKDVGGIAENISTSLADSSNKLNVQVDNLTTSFGKGVAVIENYNVAAFALNKFTSFLSEGFVEFSGFLSALGARFLQITGLVINLAFKIFFLTKVFNALNIVLNSQSTILKVLNTRLPLLNKSFIDLFDILNGGKTNAVQLTSIFTKLGEATSKITNIFKVVAKSPIKGVFIALGNILKLVTSSIRKLAIVLLPFIGIFAKLSLVVGLVVGAFSLAKNSLAEIDKRTGVLTESYGILTSALKSSLSVLNPIVVIFNKFKDTLIDIGQRAFGLVVAGISKVISVVASLVASNPFGVFSEETVASFLAIEQRLDGFTSKIADAGFKLDEFSEGNKRAVASVGESLTATTATTTDAIFGILESFTIGVNEKLGSTKESLKNFNDQANRIIKNGIVRSIAGGIQNIVTSLAKGEDVFANFGKFLLNTFGDLAIQLGTFFIAQGIATQALFQVNPPAAIIAAGAGLVALGSLLKAFGGGGESSQGAGGAGGFGGSFAGGESSLPEDSEFTADRDEFQEKTNVQLVVQGSIFNTQETANALTNLLNENFDTTGAALTGARLV